MTLPNFPQNEQCPKCDSTDLRRQLLTKAVFPSYGGPPPGPLNPPDLGLDEEWIRWICKRCGYWMDTRCSDA